MQHKLTITMDDSVYRGLITVVGRGNISRFLSDLARPHVIFADLDAGYQAKAADPAAEQEALEWSEAVMIDVSDDRPGNA